MNCKATESEMIQESDRQSSKDCLHLVASECEISNKEEDIASEANLL
jgi:hypothetical protein